MHKRTLGNDLNVSAIGLGCMGMSHAYGAPGDKKEMTELLAQSIDLGYTFFDTAEVYGTADNPHDNEELVGAALKPYRNQIVLATKFGIHFDLTGSRVNKPLIPDSRPEIIRASVEDSLSRLGTDHIDLYYQHRLDPEVPIEEVAGVMSDLIREGKSTHWGLSEATEETIRFVAFSQLANGFLTARYGKDSVFEAGTDYRTAMPQFQAEAYDQNRKLLDLLYQTAAKKDATPAQISLAWMLCKKPYLVPIPGTRKPDRLAENAKAADVALTKEEVDALDRALDGMEMSDVFGGSSIIKKKKGV